MRMIHKNLKKNRILIIVSLIFLFIYSVTVFNIYIIKKQNHEITQDNIRQNIERLHEENLKELKRILEKEINLIIQKENISEFIYKKDLLAIEKIKKRQNSPNKSFSIKETTVKNELFTYDVKTNGLFFIYQKPIFHNNKVIAQIELGLRPTHIIKEIKKVFKLSGYFFLKNIYFQKIDKKENSLKIKDYNLCTYCSSVDEFIKVHSNSIDFKHNLKTVKYENEYFNIIYKTIKNYKNEELGKIVFFNNITSFENKLYDVLKQNLLVLFLSFILILIVFNKFISNIIDKLDEARFLINNTNDAILLIDKNSLKVLDSNKQAKKMLNPINIEDENLNIKDLIEDIKDEFNLEETLKTLENKDSVITRNIYKNRKNTLVETNFNKIVKNKKEYILAISRDISKQLRMEKVLKSKNYELEELQRIISQNVLYTTSDLDGRITSISDAFIEFTGFAKKEVIGKNHKILRKESTSTEIFRNMWETINKNETWKGEVLNKKKNGEDYWLQVVITPIFNKKGKKVGYTSYREDITDKKNLEFLSNHDSLTKIYNRRAFLNHLSIKLKEKSFSILMLDIDHFKSINDTFGHQIGDNVLIKFTETIKESLSKNDFLARWGGEEFILIVENTNIENIKELVSKIQNSLKSQDFSPVPKVTSSFGFTISKKEDTQNSIQQRVDLALYEAKRNGRDRLEINL